MFRSQSHIEYALRGVQRYVSSNVASLEPDKALAPLTRPSGIAPLEPSKATHRRLRIAILQNGFIRGGTERFVINLCKGLLAPAKPLNRPSGIDPLEPHDSALNQAPAFAPAKPLNRPSGIEPLEPHDSALNQAPAFAPAKPLNLPSGIEPFASQSQYDITVINPSLLPEQQVLEPEVLATGATIQHTTTIQGITGRLKHLYLLYKLLRKGHYDVFHTNLDLFNGPNLLVAWLARVPIRICHAHASNQQRAAELESSLVFGKKQEKQSTCVEGKEDNVFAQSAGFSEGAVFVSSNTLDPSEALDPAKPLTLLNRAKGALHLLPLRLYQAVMRWMCWAFANRHIGCSDEANDFLYKAHDWRKAYYPTVIFNGIDIDKYKTPANTNYPFDHNKKYILAIGRFVPQKNPHFILDIMEKLQKMQPNIQLLWVGDGDIHQYVEKEISKRGITNIHLLGWRDDIPALMQKSNLLLMPSLFEGLSITLIEAQAAGLPCLISDTITQQAQCGLIKYKSLEDTPTSWAQEIINLLAPLDPLTRPSGIDPLALHRFSIENMASQFEQVIH